MRGILALLAVCAIAVGAAWWVEHLTGAVSVQIGTLAVQAPLSVAVLALIVLVLAIYFATRLLATLFRLPGAFRRGGDRSRRRRGDDAVTNTLIALAARAPGDARREAARARRLLGETPQTLLLAAYAGSIAGDDGEAEGAFKKLSERKDSAFLGYRGLLRMAVAREDFAAAAELAREAEAAHPGAAWLRTERAQLAVRTGAWREALNLTQDSSIRAAFGAAAAEAETDHDAAHKLAKAAWKLDPALGAAAIAYARRLRDAGREKAALDVLRRTWAQAPNPDLAAFAMAPATAPLGRLKIAQEISRLAPTNVESKLLLARLSLEAGLPADAAVLAADVAASGLTQQRLYTLQADIADAQAREAAGTDAETGFREQHRTALRQASFGDPDPAWRCEACATAHSAWHAACPVCHTAGRVKWAVPVKGMLALPA